MKSGRTILLLLVFSLLLAACKEKTGLEPILTASDCAPPCWMDIVPGETTQEEVLDRLRHMQGLVNPDSIFTATQASGVYIGWSFSRSEFEGYIPFENDRVYTISIYDQVPYRSRYGIRLDRAIELYGTPTDIHYGRGGGDFVVLNVYVINRETGIGFLYTQNETDKIVVSPEQVVRRVEFFDPADYPGVIKGSLGSTADQEFEWMGYTEIPISYRDLRDPEK